MLLLSVDELWMEKVVCRVICCLLSLIIFSIAYSADEGLEAVVEGKHQHRRDHLARQADAAPKWGVGFYPLQHDPQTQANHQLPGRVYIAPFDSSVLNYVLNKREVGRLNDNDIIIMLASKCFTPIHSRSWNSLCVGLVREGLDILVNTDKRGVAALEGVAIVRVTEIMRQFAEAWNIPGQYPSFDAAIQDKGLRKKPLEINLLPVRYISNQAPERVVRTAKNLVLIDQFDPVRLRDTLRDAANEVVIIYDRENLQTTRAPFDPSVHKLLKGGYDMLVDENAVGRDDDQLKLIQASYAVIVNNERTLDFAEELLMASSDEAFDLKGHHTIWSRLLATALKHQLDGRDEGHIHYTTLEWDYPAPIIPIQ